MGLNGARACDDGSLGTVTVECSGVVSGVIRAGLFDLADEGLFMPVRGVRGVAADAGVLGVLTAALGVADADLAGGGGRAGVVEGVVGFMTFRIIAGLVPRPAGMASCASEMSWRGKTMTFPSLPPPVLQHI